jgi:hypothetical protein
MRLTPMLASISASISMPDSVMQRAQGSAPPRNAVAAAALEMAAPPAERDQRACLDLVAGAPLAAVAAPSVATVEAVPSASCAAR